MLKRGFAKLLSRVGAKPVRKLGLAMVLLGLVGVVQAGDGIALKPGLGQALQQRAWDEALAGDPVQTPWPWENVSANETTEVRRLGLSATLLAEESVVSQRKALLSTEPIGTPAKTRQDLQLGDVAIGDRVTVTTSNGLSQVYTVTGRELAAGDQPQPDACLPLDSAVAGSLRLIIEAIHAGPKTPMPSVEQRL